MLTLAEIVEMPVLRAGQPDIVAGRDRLASPVRWVHVSDTADVTELLSGGELILSTGLPLQAGSAAAAAYVDGLAEAGAAGLVVELGHLLPRVPPAARAAARRHDLPLITLARRIRFVEVTELVHRSIVSEQVAQLEFAREVHETFTRLSLADADTDRIVATAAQLCAAPVVCEDLARIPVAFAAHGRTATSVLDRWERRSRSTPWRDRTGTGGPERWLTTPVGVGERTWARLVLPEGEPAGPGAPDRAATVLERAAAAVELARMVERDRLGLELQARGSFLADLVADRLPPSDVSVRATALGLARTTHYLAIVAQPRTLRRDPRQRPAELLDLVEQVSAAVAGEPALVGPLDEQRVGVVLGVRRASGPVLERVSAALGTAEDDAALVLGVGAHAPLADVADQLRLAGQVARVAAGLPAGRRRPFYRSADIRLSGLLGLLHDDPRVQAFVEAELAPLLTHDAAHGAGLLDLVRAYVAAGGNKTRLAAASHLSRPAIYKRLAKVEQVTGLALDDPESLLSLGVAITAYDLRDHLSR